MKVWDERRSPQPPGRASRRSFRSAYLRVLTFSPVRPSRIRRLLRRVADWIQSTYCSWCE